MICLSRLLPSTTARPRDIIKGSAPFSTQTGFPPKGTQLLAKGSATVAAVKGEMEEKPDAWLRYPSLIARGLALA